METPPHAPLGGLDPANLLKQGAAEDTFMDDAATSFNPPPIEELAAIFPQFEILGLIGQGGMGAVYKVRQKDLDRIVALKILPPAIGQSPAFSNRFTREAKALAKLNHSGIVTIHEFGQQDGLYFILMEFVDGVNLAQLMRTGRVSPREALAIVPQICDALQFAHDQGIVHRDIKPENILLDRLGRVKVADFGIAKVVAAVCEDPIRSGDTLVPTDATLAGKIIGTPQYMAPEQIDHPSEVDHRADIYALGVVFYQMLTGELPGKRLEAPSKKVHIDVRLDEIVLRAMEKDPDLRFQQASVMKTRVDDLGSEPTVPKAASRSMDNKRVDSFAIASFILGILSCVLWPLGFLPAIVFGHLSRSRIRANPALSGRGFATAGILIGYAFLTIFLAILLVSPMGPRSAWSQMTSREDGKPFELSRLSSGNQVSAEVGEARASSRNEPPKLQFLAWQDEVKSDPNWKAWRANGEIVNHGDMNLPRRLVNPSTMDVSKTKVAAKNPRFLSLWISHPSFDRQSVVAFKLLDDDGKPLETPTTNVATDTSPSSPENQNLGWVTASFCAGRMGKIPARASLCFNYSAGPWGYGTDVAVDFHGTMSLGDDVLVNDPGQGLDGKAFIQITRGRTGDTATEQFDFVAVTKDGRQLDRSGHSRSYMAQVEAERFTFDAPLKQVKTFRCRKRPIQQILWPIPLVGSDQASASPVPPAGANASVRERLVELEIAALVARKMYLPSEPVFKQAAVALDEFARANPSARDARYGEALDQRRKLLITRSKELAERYGLQHPEVVENRQKLEAVEQIIRTRMYLVIRTPDVSQPAQMKFHFDCAGDTMQQVLLRLGKQFNVRICWENDEKIFRGRTVSVMMKDLLEELEIREASGKLSDREKERLVELRRFQMPETAGEVFTRYHGELAASSLEGLLDQLTKGTTDRARKSKSGKTWMVSPIEGSRLEFPVTLNTRDLTIAKAVDQLCSQSPDKLERSSGGERPWLNMTCKPVSFQQEPAWEVLCRISEEAEFDLIWEAIPDLVINPSYSSVAGYFAHAAKQDSAQSPGNHSAGPSPAESFVELELGVARARESYLDGDPARSEAEEKLNAFIAKNPDFPNEESRQIAVRKQVDLLAGINDLSKQFGTGHSRILELNHQMERLEKLPEIGKKQLETEAAERILSRDLPSGNRLEIRLVTPEDAGAEVLKIGLDAGDSREIRVSQDVIVCDRHIMAAGFIQEGEAGNLDITLNEVGARRLAEATKAGHGTLRLAIMIDGKVESAPVINGQLGKNLQISGRRNSKDYIDFLQSLPIWDAQKNSLEAAYWLRGIDEGKYSESHAASATILSQRFSEKTWGGMLTHFRKPLGIVTSRGLKKYSEAKAEDGRDYRLMLFETHFSNHRNAIETVTFVKESDGAWKATGYFIR